jgi:hypothetical protein
MTAEDLDRCPSCQAPHGPDEALCWMCGRKFWSDSPAPSKRNPPPPPIEERRPAPRPNPLPRPAATPAASDNSWTQPVLIVAFILILIGLALGGGTGSSLLWLGLLPAFFVTALSGFRSPKKKPETLLEMATWLVTKLASAVAVIILAGVAIVIALMAVCFALVAVLGHH